MMEILDDPLGRFITFTISNLLITLLCVSWGVNASLRRIRRLGVEITRANMEAPERPFTVSFSPDIPALLDARRTDAWIRTEGAPDALFFNPTTQRWQSQAFVFATGTAFVNGSLVSFRAVPTGVNEDFIARLHAACDDGRIAPEFLSELSLMDANEVFSIVESCGLVRQFNRALEAVDTQGAPSVGQLFNAFAVQRRAIDLS